MDLKKYKIIKVVVEKKYMVPINDDTSINGWSLKEVIKDWFERVPLFQYHANRDSSLMRGTERVISATVED